MLSHNNFTYIVIFIYLFFHLILTNCQVYGIKQIPCPPQALVDITSEFHQTESSNSSKLITKSGISYEKNFTRYKNGKKYGCPCHFKTCLQLCCPIGYSANGRGCEIDDYTEIIVDRGYEEYGLKNHYHYFTHDPCHLSSTDRVLLDYYFNLKKDGSIHLLESKRKLNLGKYCLLRITNSNVYWAGGCVDLNWTILMIWFLISLCISAIFLIALFIYYTIKIESKNLKGSTLKSYLASNIGLIIISGIGLLSQIKISLPQHFYFNINIGFGACFFGFACMLWLNVMAFDIWRDFRYREIRLNLNIDMEKEEKIKFICYSIYAWGCSAIYALIFTLSRLIWVWYGSTQKLDRFLTYFAVLPIFFITFCNVYLSISTALRIKQRKKYAINMANTLNELDIENEKWFHSYLKLLTTVGFLLLLITVAFYSPNNKTYLGIVCGFQSLQSIVTFFIFILFKNDYQISFRNQFYKFYNNIMIRIFRRRDSSTSVN